ADTVGVNYTNSVTVNGGTGTVTLGLTNVTTVTGITVVKSGNSINISGTPSASGTVSFTATAFDSLGSSITASYHFTVNAAPTLGTLCSVAGTTNVAYNQTITASGGTSPLTFTVSNVSNSIAGLTLPNNVTASSYAINGTPTAAGTVTFTL